MGDGVDNEGEIRTDNTWRTGLLGFPASPEGDVPLSTTVHDTDVLLIQSFLHRRQGPGIVPRIKSSKVGESVNNKEMTSEFIVDQQKSPCRG